MNFKSLSRIILFCFPFVLCAQDATNINVNTTADELIVTYDLVGVPDAVYEVVLQFQKEDLEVIVPKSVNGDIGRVVTGNNKRIVWEVYNDVSGLSGSLTPQIFVKEVQTKAAQKPQPTPVPPSPKNPNPIIDVLKGNKSSSNGKSKNNNYRVGYKVGLGSSNVDATLSREAFKKKFTWEVGPVFRWTIHRRIFLQPEVLYHLQQYDKVLSPNENARTRNHYLRGQLVLGASPFGMGIHFNTGIYYGHLLGSKTKSFLVTGTEEVYLDDYTERNGESSPFLSGDLGYLIGGSVNVGKGAFSLGVYFSQGFDSFTNEDYFIIPDSPIEVVPEKLTNRATHFFISRAF